MIINNIVSAIKFAKNAWGLRLIFRYYGGRIDLPIKYCLHEGPLCKQLREDMQIKCNIDCVQKVNKRIFKERKPYLKLCHAGVYEYVVPVFSSSGYEGSFFLGPMVKSIKYDKYKTEYALLPRCNRKTLKDAKLLLPVIARLTSLEHDNLTRTGGSAGPDKIRQALELISGNFNGKLKASEIAKECGLSQWYFLHLFKRRTGTSFTDHIKRLRMEKAKELLAGTAMKVGVVAEETGYRNQNIFFMAFKKYAGLTPGVFRKRSRQKDTI